MMKIYLPLVLLCFLFPLAAYGNGERLNLNAENVERIELLSPFRFSGYTDIVRTYADENHISAIIDFFNSLELTPGKPVPVNRISERIRIIYRDGSADYIVYSFTGLSLNGSAFVINESLPRGTTGNFDDLFFGTREERARRSSNPRAYPTYIFQRQMSRWNSQLCGKLSDILSDIYTNTDNMRASMMFHSARENSSSPSSIWYIEGADTWLRDIESFEEGFAAVSSYDGVDWVQLIVAYDVILDALDINSELENIKLTAARFLLPLYELTYVEGRRVSVSLLINYLNSNPNSTGSNSQLGRFLWRHYFRAGPALAYENIANLSLEGFVVRGLGLKNVENIELVDSMGRPWGEFLGLNARNSIWSLIDFFNSMALTPSKSPIGYIRGPELYRITYRDGTRDYISFGFTQNELFGYTYLFRNGFAFRISDRDQFKWRVLQFNRGTSLGTDKFILPAVLR